MFVHSVYFWLREDLTNEQREAFNAGVRSLATIESLRHVFIGTPADTDRPVIDRSYDFALTTIFDDDAGHDAYQIHPSHEAFKVNCSPLWRKVVIYDSVE